VRPDFKGLPKGGSVDQGEDLFEEKCASCHGSFGESNEVFPAGRRHHQGRHQDRPRQGLSSGELPQRTTHQGGDDIHGLRLHQPRHAAGQRPSR
jgi:cytochrome c